MNIPKLTDLIGKDLKVKFDFYRDGELWYKTENGFKFPVPIDDTGTATFNSEDKSIFFMRWIRQHLEFVTASLKGPEPEENKDCHTEHCYQQHKHCKYGNFENTCSVVSGLKNASFPCNCEWI